MNTVYDYIIIGAGVIGCSTAYYLKRMNSEANILLIDKNQRPGAGNTGKSAALYRDVFSSPTSQLLASSSIQFYKTIANQISLDDIGYLWLLTDKDDFLVTRNTHKTDNSTWNKKSLSLVKQLIHLNTTASSNFPAIKHSIFGKNCGSLSARKLAEYYMDQFNGLGGKIQLGREVIHFILSGKEKRYPPWEEIQLQAIRDQTDQIYQADKYIFCTGAWTFNLLSNLGIYSGVLPKKRQLFGIRIDSAEQIMNNTQVELLPVIILPLGVYIKPILRTKMLVIGLADDLGQPYITSKIDFQNIQSDNDFFVKAIQPVLKHYFPKLTNYRLELSWAGYYSYSLDKNPVIEQQKNIIWSSGTSGSGIMKADAIGRITAAKICNKKEISLFGGKKINPDSLSLKARDVVQEDIII